MTIAEDEVHQAPFPEEVDAASVPQGELTDPVPRTSLAGRHRPQPRDVDLHVEVPGIGEEETLLGPFKVGSRHDVSAPGGGDEDVCRGDCQRERSDGESIHRRLHGADRVHLAHGDPGTQAVRPLGDPPAAPPVPDDDDRLPGDKEVRRAEDPVPGRLARPVAVVEQVLHLGVVHRDHREAEPPFTGERPQTRDPGRRLLAAPTDRSPLPLVEEADEVSPVVQDQVRPRGEDLAQVGDVLRLGDAASGMDLNPLLLGQGGGDVVLRRERVAPGDGHLRSAVAEEDRETGRLRLEVDTDPDPASGERVLLYELTAQGGEERHVRPRPIDLQSSPSRLLTPLAHLRTSFVLHPARDPGTGQAFGLEGSPCAPRS